MLGCNVAACVCCAALCGAAVVRWPVQTWDCVTLASGHGVSSQFTRAQALYPEISVRNWTRKQVIIEYQGILKVIFNSCTLFGSSGNELNIKKMQIKL